MGDRKKMFGQASNGVYVAKYHDASEPVVWYKFSHIIVDMARDGLPPEMEDALWAGREYEDGDYVVEFSDRAVRIATPSSDVRVIYLGETMRQAFLYIMKTIALSADSGSNKRATESAISALFESQYVRQIFGI